MVYPAAFAAFRQFIVWQLVQAHPKPDKVPIDWRTGYAANAHDPEIWMSGDEAIAAAARMGPAFGIGFVFTADDPFWFLDIDAALSPDGVWSPVAQQLAQVFGSQYCEVSQSGKGLHFFGFGPVPEHGCKNKSFGLELYHTERFVALTGTHARGDAACAAPAGALEWLVSSYFKPGAPGVELNEITKEPRSDWRGPTDDDELLRRAMQSQSKRAMFGNHATFADLWTCNVPVLATAYPTDTGDAFNRSNADMALMQQFAFWTGCHGERMLSLMQRSSLKREKWETHRTYLSVSCMRACSMQREVLCDTPPEPSPLATPPAGSDAPVMQREVTGSTFLSPSQQAEMFKGCVYVSDAHAILVPGGELQDQGRFRVTFGGFTFAMDTSNERTVRNAWEAFTESQALRPPRADTTCFKPNLPAGAMVRTTGRIAANAWWPVEVARSKGDAGPFLRHLSKILPNERDALLFLSYMAACVQHKGTKFQWAPLLQGVEGNGKTFFSFAVMNAVSMRYSHMPRPSDISSKFNPWLRNKLVIAVEDVYIEHERVEVFEMLKPMITGRFQPVEQKGVDQVLADICCNFIFNCNPKDGMRKTRNDRRIAPFFCKQQQKEDLQRDGLTADYFASLHAWYDNGGMPVVNELLHTMQIPDEINPALGGIAPVTSSTAEAIDASLGPVEQHIMEAIEQHQIGFAGGWVSSVYLDRLLEAKGLARRLQPIKRLGVMQSLGYDYHPALQDGRTPGNVLPDATRPCLYVRNDHIARAITNGVQAAQAYSSAQMGLLPHAA